MTHSPFWGTVMGASLLGDETIIVCVVRFGYRYQCFSVPSVKIKVKPYLLARTPSPFRGRRA